MQRKSLTSIINMGHFKNFYRLIYKLCLNVDCYFLRLSPLNQLSVTPWTHFQSFLKGCLAVWLPLIVVALLFFWKMLGNIYPFKLNLKLTVLVYKILVLMYFSCYPYWLQILGLFLCVRVWSGAGLGCVFCNLLYGWEKHCNSEELQILIAYTIWILVQGQSRDF